MSYKSPIDLIISQAETEMENEIVKVVQRMGINVDKGELMRALAYDRNQYVRGYYDRDSEVIRCKDCRHYGYKDMTNVDGFCYCLKRHEYPNPDWYCGDGERRETNDEE